MRPVSEAQKARIRSFLAEKPCPICGARNFIVDDAAKAFAENLDVPMPGFVGTGRVNIFVAAAYCSICGYVHLFKI